MYDQGEEHLSWAEQIRHLVNTANHVAPVGRVF